jgi:hypothetical protein
MTQFLQRKAGFKRLCSQVAFWQGRMDGLCKSVACSRHTYTGVSTAGVCTCFAS